MRWTPVVGSVAINAALLALLNVLSARPESPPAREPITVEVLAPPKLEPPQTAPINNGRGGRGATALATAGHREAARHVEAHAERQRAPWHDVEMRYEPSPNASGSAIETGDGFGGGIGTGFGGGIGAGVGAGIGDGVGVGLRDIAALRVPVPSKARPAKLLHPTRETEVDAAELFGAIVTVDTDGDVVGARMTRSHPGSRGDTAASMIWQFRYSPALDDAGRPVRSTFEQMFAVR